MRAYFDDYEWIRVYLDTEAGQPFFLEGVRCEIAGYQREADAFIYDLKVPEVRVGAEMMLECGSWQTPVHYRMIVKTERFSREFDAADEKLGFNADVSGSQFRLWAPTAARAWVEISGTRIAMDRSANGVYIYRTDADLHGQAYVYHVRVNGRSERLTDPYAQASLPNRQASVAVDWKQLDLTVHPLAQHADPIIMELHVRDFSMDPEVPFQHRGQFLGLLESHGRYGLNHILDLGITHVQLMPVADFETVDELDQLSRYNWGYDVMQFQALEGSYSSQVIDPFQVIRDFSHVVNSYHRHGIGVNLDVVFNHVYETETSPLQQSVPYYYFRYETDGSLADGSFCGNEIASEMPMCRKLIVDSCVHFANHYGIDGLRFDLMGLLDIETIHTVCRNVKHINPHFMVYGEGWDMQSVYPSEDRATLNQAHRLPEVGFFNDRFRNTIGGDLEGTDLGYADRMLQEDDRVRDVFSGCVPDPFSSAGQSINYVECHDNYTIADKIRKQSATPQHAAFMNGITLLARGTPFLQIGQTFFRDKKGDENSYQSPDCINAIVWAYLDRYSWMHEQAKEWIAIRKRLDYRNLSFEVRGGCMFCDTDSGSIVFDPKALRIEACLDIQKK